MSGFGGIVGKARQLADQYFAPKVGQDSADETLALQQIAGRGHTLGVLNDSRTFKEAYLGELAAEFERYSAELRKPQKSLEEVARIQGVLLALEFALGIVDQAVLQGRKAEEELHRRKGGVKNNG